MSSSGAGGGSAAGSSGSGGAWCARSFAISAIASITDCVISPPNSLVSRAPPSASLRWAATAVRSIFAVKVRWVMADLIGALLATTASMASATITYDNGDEFEACESPGSGGGKGWSR